MPLDTDVAVPRGRSWRDLPDAPPVSESPGDVPDAMTPPPAQAVTGAHTVELPGRALQAGPPPPPTPDPVPAVRRPPWIWIITGVAAVAAVAIVFAAAPWEDDSDGLVTAGVNVDTVPRRVTPLPPVNDGLPEDTDIPAVPQDGAQPVPIPSTPGEGMAPDGEATPGGPQDLDDLFGGNGTFDDLLPPELEGLLEDMLQSPEGIPGDPGLVPPELAPLFDYFLNEGLGTEEGLDEIISPDLQRMLSRLLAGEELGPEDLLWLLGSPEAQDLLDSLLGNG